jgi:multidrug efflux pump subunit AcrA (membrane-fusion protein)
MTMNPTRVWILAAVAAAATTAAACNGGHAESPATDDRPAIAVTTATVARAPLGDTFEAGGLVEARTSALLSSRIVAPVRELRVKAGDRVRQGDVLVVLDGADLEARSRSATAAAHAAAQDVDAAVNGQREADAALALARTNRARVDQLHARKSATQQELDNADAALRMAEARAQAAAAKLAAARAGVDSAAAARDAASTTAGFATITAPFDGVVSATMVETGNMAAPGQPLLRVEDVRNLRLTVRVDESRLAAARVGATVPVVLDAGADGATTTTDGTIAEVGRVDDAAAHTYLVKIALPAGTRVEPGRFGRARFTTGTREALRLPEGALRRQGQITNVFVVEDGVARLRMVDVRGAEVVAGIAVGDTVIVGPPAELTDGRRVTVGGVR